jgi:hypothetical protein
VPLTDVSRIPTGSEIDALDGPLRSSVTASGQVETQTATLTGGIFKLTHVIRDTVLVDDFLRHKTVLLHAEQSYLAKAIRSPK